MSDWAGTRGLARRALHSPAPALEPSPKGVPTITHAPRDPGTSSEAPRPRSPSHPVELTLHIGSGKTGTSSIQQMLAVNREALAAAGWLYPQAPGVGRHVRLGLYLRDADDLAQTPAWHRQGFDSPERFRKVFRRRLFTEIDEAALPRMLMSDEALYAMTRPNLRRLRTFTDRFATSVDIVVYLRRQDEHLVSRYQQVVKVGETRRLVDWASGDMTFTYDYQARLGQWRRIIAPRRLVVRRFEPGRFKDDSLLADFLDACAIDVQPASLELPGHRNESLGAEAVELLRLINLHLREGQGIAQVDIDHRDLVTRMAERCPGPPLTLPEVELTAFMARWADSNAAVARDHFGEAELFGPPRRGRETVVDQRLDPARIEHLVALLELPERWVEPLRALSERENG